VRYDIETEQETIKELKQEQNELEREANDLPKTPIGDIDSIESDIDRLRNRKQTLDSEISDLRSVIRFNEEMLDESNKDVFEALNEGLESEGPVTDQLLADEEITCGSEVVSDQIDVVVDKLRELSRDKTGEADDIEADIRELEKKRQDLKKQQNRREQVERRLDQIEAEIQEHTANIDQFQERRDTITAEIEEIEDAVEALEDESYTEILDLHKEANQLEYELGRLENDLENVETEIESIESRLSDREELDEKRDEIADELEDLQTKIEQIERQAIEEFNEHMETVLSLLGYQNLDRIWLERTEKEVREGRRKVTKSTFNLHVIRKTESGKAYEDTVDHLSESEREVTGLIFALAGYLVYDVYESVPFMLLDSLEAIDAERISTLISYLEEYPDYLIVALLPEDAQALADEYDRVSDI